MGTGKPGTGSREWGSWLATRGIGSVCSCLPALGWVSVRCASYCSDFVAPRPSMVCSRSVPQRAVATDAVRIAISSVPSWTSGSTSASTSLAWCASRSQSTDSPAASVPGSRLAHQFSAPIQFIPIQFNSIQPSRFPVPGSPVLCPIQFNLPGSPGSRFPAHQFSSATAV
jgi:hypothetical protein